MSNYEKWIFICEHDREDGGCCHKKDAKKVRKLMKDCLKDQGLHKKYRAVGSSCLDRCSEGVTMAVFPDNVWYGNVTEKDVKTIISQHLKKGIPVKKLRIEP